MTAMFPSIRARKGLIPALLATLLLAAGCKGEFRRAPNTADLKQRLDKLRVVGRLMMIAAHPDDENTALLAWSAQGRHYETAYLSVTRGEGGQNLIGTEQGMMLGLLRTQELLAARRIDGAQQFFTRAIDFGFSKTAEETLRMWGHEQALSDVVWIIRSFRPDVVVLRFTGTPRDGHGHHQASAILGKEAFSAAADPKQFPEQLKYVEPWRAKRLVWNGFSFNRQQEQEMAQSGARVSADLGEFNPVLGYSYSELAGLSRSQHRSQGMGTGERRGSALNYFLPLAGEGASKDLFDGIDTTWNRLPGGAAVAAALDKAESAFDIEHPEKLLPALFEARAAIVRIQHPDARQKLVELDEAIAEAAGLWLDANADVGEAAPASAVAVTLSAVCRGPVRARIAEARLEGIGGAPAYSAADLPPNEQRSESVKLTVPADQPPTQPYWLREPGTQAMYKVSDQRLIGKPENDPVLVARVGVEIDGARIELTEPVEHRWIDRVRGELRTPLRVIPAVSVALDGRALIFPRAQAKDVTLEVSSNAGKRDGTVSLEAPAGWAVTPASQRFEVEQGAQQELHFTVRPPQGDSEGFIRAVAHTQTGDFRSGLARVDYEHIEPQVVLVPAESRAVREDVQISAHRIGYVMGAGDEVPEALKQLGCDVTLLEASDLARGDLSKFDAIVTGVRAWNTRPDLRANAERLWAYANGGGTVVVQYNVLEGFQNPNSPALRDIGPYPIRISRDRVTVEEAPVKLLKPGSPLLTLPNHINPKDWDGWVQERGLYFAGEWDPRYEALLEMSDPGERGLDGSTLTAPVGRGRYVLTTLSWFRQLPAGVPGAYRIFADLVSGGKPAGGPRR